MYDSNKLLQRHRKEMRRLAKLLKRQEKQRAGQERLLEKRFSAAVSARKIVHASPFSLRKLSPPDPVTLTGNIVLGALLIGFFAILQ